MQRLSRLDISYACLSAKAQLTSPILAKRHLGPGISFSLRLSRAAASGLQPVRVPGAAANSDLFGSSSLTSSSIRRRPLKSPRQRTAKSQGYYANVFKARVSSRLPVTIRTVSYVLRLPVVL
jgi:hypothetical protein